MNTVLSIDLGASSGRAILTNLDNGKVETTEVSRFSQYEDRFNNTLRWNFEKIFLEILNSIKLAEEIKEFEYLAVDTWGVDFGLLDSKGNLIEAPYHYRDTRTNGSLEKVKRLIQPHELYNMTGIQLMEINTLFQLFTLKEQNPEVYYQAETLLLMPDLINYFLTGVIKTERTIASTTQLYNPQKRNWDYELIKKLDLNPSLFTEIVDPGTIIGDVKNSIIKGLDISNKKVIAVGSHDTASAIVCTPYAGEKNLFLSSGTWSLMGTQLEVPIINEKTYENDLSNEIGVDNKVTLLKNITGLWLIQEAKRQLKKEGKEFSFSEIANIAIEAESLNCYFDTDLPELNVPSDIPQKIKDLAIRTKQEVPRTDGQMVKTIYENLALKYRSVYEELVDVVGTSFEKIFIVGGGANADYLSQCTANALNIEVITGYTEATAMGNSLVQLVTSNIIQSKEEGLNIFSNAVKTKTFYPQDIDLWQKKYKLYISEIKK